MMMMDAPDGAELCFPQLFNTSCKKPTRNHSEELLFYFLILISALTTALNLLLIIAISHFRQLHTTTNLILLSLGVSDFLVGLVVMPGDLMQTGNCWFSGDLVCALYYFLLFIIISASAECMVLISVDRYIAICYPLHYASKFSLYTVRIVVSVCWIYAFLVNLVLFNENLRHPGKYSSCQGECVVNISGELELAFGFIIPVSIIVVLHLRVFVVAVTQARAMRSQITIVKTRSSQAAAPKRSELKAATTLGIVVAVFLMCYCPYYCVFLIGGDILIGSDTEIFMAFLLYLNSCLNPLIYVFCYPWFRKAIRLIVTFRVMAPGSRDTRIL